jgi:hypothetical protein
MKTDTEHEYSNCFNIDTQISTTVLEPMLIMLTINSSTSVAVLKTFLMAV